MAIATQYGTATISATVSGPGSEPYVDVTSTLTHTTSSDYADNFTIISGVCDLKGDIAVSATRLTSTSVRFSASRQIPAGEEIVFKWSTVDGTA